YDTPVMVRLTTRIAHSRSPVETAEPLEQLTRPYQKNVAKYVMMPGMAIARHKLVEARQNRLAADSSGQADISRHQVIRRSADLGIITSGISYQYVREALPDASVLKLGLIWPLPLDLIREFASSVRRLVVIEELDPFLETEIRSAGIPCEGKALFSPLGEYSAVMIRRALGASPEPEPALPAPSLTVAPGRPPVMCAGCPHKGLFLALNRLKLVVSGDIGCYTLGALNPTNAMDTCVCMGASIGMAHGMDKATDGTMSGCTVAVIGDSTFLHSGITSLINSIYNQSNSTVIILDNSITGMTGHQQNPSTGLSIRLQPAPAVDLEALCSCLGAASVRVADPADTWEIQKVVSEEVARPGVSVIIARRPCALIPAGRGRADQVVRVDRDLCRKCKACIRVMCPALTAGPDGGPVIDPAACTGCGLCIRICRFGALRKGGEA
ncbi:MAG TPA: indolepyruvate ferredoxin oxidoreductase subunit alpha, partial [Clostridiales bacterium]|nr:indolepyruvate ferredoxin oxidoreductase subunit alpha [Clostridiales bacterium]